MFENKTISGSQSYPKFLDANRDSLFYVLDQFYHPGVICADRGRTCGRIGDTIRFLKRNLEREEKFMKLSGYPNIDDHKRDHATALRKLEKLRISLTCNHYDNGLVSSFIESWADDHALAFDKPFCDFLQSHRMGRMTHP